MQTVLLVEQDFRYRNLCCEVLVKAGYLVRDAADAEEVIQAVQKYQPDAIVLNPETPGAEQLIVFLEVWERSKGIPVVIYTDDRQDETLLPLEFVEAVVMKSDDPQPLRQALASVLGEGAVRLAQAGG